MSKTICKTENKDKLAKKQAGGMYQCAKCGAKAVKEKYVCKPQKV